MQVSIFTILWICWHPCLHLPPSLPFPVLVAEDKCVLQYAWIQAGAFALCVSIFTQKCEDPMHASATS